MLSIVDVHTDVDTKNTCVYNHSHIWREAVKRNKLENELKKCGWNLLRHGGSHDIWTNELGDTIAFPRHPDINEITAKMMIKKANSNKVIDK